MNGLSPYLRAAQREHADPAVIFATAGAEDFDAPQLARLADALHEHHPRWRLAPQLRHALIDRLIEEGWTVTKIAATIGCSRNTVYSRAREGDAAAEGTPENRINKRSECSVSTPRVSFPICSCSERGSRPIPASDPGLCFTCGCRFEATA